MGLDSAHKGYEYQDLLSAFFIITEMLNSSQAMFKIDKKESENDKFDDLTIIRDKSAIKRQVKYSENKILEKADLSTNTYDLALDVLFNSWREIGHTVNTELRLCLAWDMPSEKDILDILVEEPHEDDYGTGKVHFYKINLDSIWKEGELPIVSWKRLREKSSSIDRKEFSAFLENLIIEVNLPKASLDVNTPDELEQLVISRLEDFGVGKFPNDKKPVIDVLLMLVHIVKNARAKGKTLSMQEIVYRLGLQNNYGNIEQTFKVEQSINIINENKFEEFYKVVNTNNNTVLLGEPGSGKSWFVQNFINYLHCREIKVVRHYCYTGLNDIYEIERITLNIFLANLINDIMMLFPYISKIKPTKYGVDIDELQILLDNIEEETLIIIDGLDHIGRIYNFHREIIREVDVQIIKAISELRLSEKVKIILASQPIDEVVCLKDKNYNLYCIPSWEHDEVVSLMRKYGIVDVNISYGRNLSDEVFEKSCGNPLYATYLINEIKNGSIINLTLAAINELPVYSHNLVSYYEYLLAKLKEDDKIAMILAGAPFYLNEEELQEITSLGKYVGKSIKVLKSILKVNQCTGGYTIYHESFRRFIIEKLKNNGVDEEIIYCDLIRWLERKGFYQERKAFNNLLLLLFESNRLEDIRKYIDKDFVIQSLFYGNPIRAIKRNFEILIKTASKLKSYEALIIGTELGSMLYSLEYSFDENSEVYYKSIGYVHSFTQLKELLVYDGFTTLNYKDGLKACYLCSKNNIIPDWDPYINLLLDSADTKTRNDPEFFRYYICAQLDCNHDILNKLEIISQDGYSQYRNVVIDEFQRRDNIEELNKIIDILPNRELWDASIKNFYGVYEYKSEDIVGILDTIKEFTMVSEANSHILKEFAKQAKNLVKFNKDIADKFISGVKNRNWFYNWLIYVIKINEVINEYLDNSEIPEEKIVTAYEWLVKDTEPFKGEPRACDIFYGAEVVYDTIQMPLKYIRTKETWEKIISILTIVSDKTTTSFQGSISGPLSTYKLLELLVEVLDLNNSEVIEEFYKKIIKDEENYRFYTYLADYSMKLAIFYGKVRKTKEAFEELAKGVRYLVSYSFHKDRTLSRLLNCIKNINSLDSEIGHDYIKRLKQLADAVIYHTDGKDTKYYPHEWFEKLLEVDLKIALLYLKTELAENTCYWILEDSLESLLINYNNQISPKVENVLFRTLPSRVTDDLVESYLNNIEVLIEMNEIPLARISISELINRFGNNATPSISDEKLNNKIKLICDKLSVPYNQNIYKKYSKQTYGSQYRHRDWVREYNKKISPRKSFSVISEEELFSYLKSYGLRENDIYGFSIYLQQYRILDEKSKYLIKNIIEICTNWLSDNDSTEHLVKAIEAIETSDNVKAYAYMCLYTNIKDGWGTRFNRVDLFKKAFNCDYVVAEECFFNHTYHNFTGVEYTLAVGDKIVNSLIAIDYDKEKVIRHWAILFDMISYRLAGQREYCWDIITEDKYCMDNEELLYYILLCRLRFGESLRQKWVFSGLDMLLQDEGSKCKFIKPLKQYLDDREYYNDFSLIAILKLIQKHFTYDELESSGIRSMVLELYPDTNELVNYLIRHIFKVKKTRLYVPYIKKSYNKNIVSLTQHLFSIDSRIRELNEWGLNIVSIVDKYATNVCKKEFVERMGKLIYNKKYGTFISNTYYYDCLLKCMAEEIDRFLNLSVGEGNLGYIENQLFDTILDDFELILAQQNSIIPRPKDLPIPSEVKAGIYELEDCEWVVIAQYEEECTYTKEYTRTIEPDNLQKQRNFSGLIFNMNELRIPYLTLPDDYRFLTEQDLTSEYLFKLPSIDGVIATNINIDDDIQLNYNKKLLLWIKDDILSMLKIKNTYNENGIVGLDENDEEVLKYSWWQTYYFYTEDANDMIPYLTGSRLVMRSDKFKQLCEIALSKPEYHVVIT